MTRFALVILAAGLATLPGAAVYAQTVSPPAATPAPPLTPPGPDDGRYTFHRTGESFVRLDSRTGQVSTCGRNATGWSCQASPDDRTALESEIGRLQGDSAALKKELLTRGLALPAGVKADPPSAKNAEKPSDSNPSAKLPSDADIDNAMAFVERLWRRMVDMMANVQRDIQRKN